MLPNGWEGHLRYIKDEMYQDVVYESEKKGSYAVRRFLNELKMLKCLESKSGVFVQLQTFQTTQLPFSHHSLLILILFLKNTKKMSGYNFYVGLDSVLPFCEA